MGPISPITQPNAKIWVPGNFLGCPKSPYQVSAKSVTGHKRPCRHTQKTTLKHRATGEKVKIMTFLCSPAETNGNFGPPQTQEARDLSDKSAHSHKVPRHNPEAEKKPQPVEVFFPVDNIANISAQKRKATK